MAVNAALIRNSQGDFLCEQTAYYDVKRGTHHQAPDSVLRVHPVAGVARLIKPDER